MNIKSKVSAILAKYGLSLEEDAAPKESKTLEDGTAIYSDGNFEPGSSIFVVNEEGEHIPLPDGEYKTQDGTLIQVAEGKVADGNPEETPEETTEETPEETPEMENKDKEEEYKEEEDEDEVKMSAVKLSKMVSTIESLENKIERLEAKLAKTSESSIQRVKHTPAKKAPNMSAQQQKIYEIFT